MQIDDADLLDEFLSEQVEYSPDFQAYVLRKVSKGESIPSISLETEVPVSTIYSWISDWNQTRRLEKKRR